MEKKTLLMALVIAGSLFVLENNNSLAAGPTEIKSSITTPTTWTKEGSPYIISNYIFVSAPLVINPGVVVKFKAGQHITFANVFVAEGTEAEKIIFTSIKDDSAGGDTNGDGNATVPGAGDWGYMMFYGNNPVSLNHAKVLYGSTKNVVMGAVALNTAKAVSIQNSEIKYSGYIGLFIYNSQPLKVENNIISNNSIGVYVDNRTVGAAKIINNSITENTLGAGTSTLFWYYEKLDARNNWWGSRSGPYHKTKNTLGKGNTITDGILFDQWLAKDPFKVREPVVLVPGAGASVNLDLMISGALSDNWKMFDNTYDGLIEAFKQMGYEEGKDLFIVYYDWRKSTAESAEKFLDPIIKKANTLNGTSKVNIIAHSMGGLVARSYVQGSAYANDVDNLVLIGTPNKGASDAYSVWEGGYIPKNWDGRMTMVSYVGYLMTKNTSSSYSIIHNFIPSIKELLPVYSYLYPKELTADDTKNYQSMIEVNDYLKNLNDNVDLLNQRVKLSIVSGTGQGTVNKIPVIPSDDEVLWKDGKPDPMDPQKDETIGDGRVLISSSQLQGQFNDILNYDHEDIVSQSEKIIAQRFTEELDSIYPAPDVSNEMGFWFASPVDIEIEDPNGKIISANQNDIPLAKYASESKPDGFKLVSIPNPVEGNYEIKITGNGNGEYHIGSEYLDYREGRNDYSSLVQGTINLGEVKEYKVVYNPSSVENTVTDIKLKDATPPTITGSATTVPNENGWYNSDVTVHFEASDDESGIESVTEDVILSGEGIGQSVTGTATDKAGNSASFTVGGINIDKTPPSVEIISPEKGKDYLNNQWLQFDYSVADAVSGLQDARTEILYDGNPVASEKIDLALQNLGTHSLFISAADKAGNEISKEASFVIDTNIQAIQDNVNYYFELGLIPNSGKKVEILAHLKSLETDDQIERLIQQIENMKDWQIFPQAKALLIASLKYLRQ